MDSQCLDHGLVPQDPMLHSLHLVEGRCGDHPISITHLHYYLCLTVCDSKPTDFGVFAIQEDKVKRWKGMVQALGQNGARSHWWQMGFVVCVCVLVVYDGLLAGG